MNKEHQLEFAKQLAEVGIEETVELTPREYRKKVDEVIEQLAAKGFRFTADDVRELAGAPVISPNAFGSIMKNAVKAGIIKRVGYRPAIREKSRSHILSVYVGAKNE
jgi:hypothetical protein